MFGKNKKYYDEYGDEITKREAKKLKKEEKRDRKRAKSAANVLGITELILFDEIWGD